MTTAVAWSETGPASTSRASITGNTRHMGKRIRIMSFLRKRIGQDSRLATLARNDYT
jgi:hypothetical protein